VAVKEDHGPTSVDSWNKPGFERYAAAASEHMSLVGEAEIPRRPTVLRPGHLDTSHQDLDLLAEGQELQSRSVARRRELGEGPGLPEGDKIQCGEPKG
jgi:hypothetical protein